jgi:hypothetical protein
MSQTSITVTSAEPDVLANLRSQHPRP